VGAIVAAVMTFYCGTACGIGIWKAVVIGAVSGAAGAAANGGNIFKGALIGGLSGAAFHGIGDSFGIKTGDFFGTKLSIGDFISKTALHGLVGGVMSVLQGGKFGHGFASAGVTQAFSGQIDRLDINTAQSAQRVITAAVVGGTTSVISGGKFGNGAVTGAFSQALNDELHDKADNHGLDNASESFKKGFSELSNDYPELTKGVSLIPVEGLEVARACITRRCIEVPMKDFMNPDVSWIENYETIAHESLHLWMIREYTYLGVLAMDVQTIRLTTFSNKFIGLAHKYVIDKSLEMRSWAFSMRRLEKPSYSGVEFSRYYHDNL